MAKHPCAGSGAGSEESVMDPARRNILKGASALAGGVALWSSGAAIPTAGAVESGITGIPAYDEAIRKQVEGKTLRVGFTPPVLSEFFNVMEHACFRKANEYTERFGIKWDWERASPAGNFHAVEGQYNIIQNWITSGVDAILVCTAGNFKDTQELYRQARKQGVTIIQFNMPVELWPEDKIEAVSSVGYNNILQSGYAAGQYIADKLGGKGKLLQIWGPSGSTWSEARQRGFDMVLAEYPDLEVVGKADGGYVRNKGFQAAQNLLTSHPDVDAIYGENEEMALGASQAIATQGLNHWDGNEGILTIGADGLPSGYQAIREGRLTATVQVGGVAQGLWLIETLFASHALGMSVGKILNVPCNVVDKTNVDIPDAYAAWALEAEGL